MTKISNYVTSLILVKITSSNLPFQFITIWWLTLILAVLFFFIYIMNTLILKKYITKRESPKLYKIVKTLAGLRWVSSLIPLFSVSYIMILYSYINTMSCLLNWNSSLTSSTDRFERCYAIITKPRYFIIHFIIGFSIAYIVLSAIVISNEPLPEPGMIAFTSRSTIVMKHSNLLIMIMYNILQIVVNEWNKSIIFHVGRCTLAIIIIFLDVIYVIYVGTCYVRIIDAWRVYSLLLVAWACVISLIFAISPDGSSNFIYSIYNAFGREQSPAHLFLIGFGITSVIVLTATIIYLRKSPGGVGEDGKYGHGTKSYTEAFLPRSNNVAISIIKDLLLNNIKHRKKNEKNHQYHHHQHHSQNYRHQQPLSITHNPTITSTVPEITVSTSYLGTNNILPSGSILPHGIPTPRLLYLQDELKYIADD